MNSNIDTKPDWNYILLSIPARPLRKHTQMWQVFYFNSQLIRFNISNAPISILEKANHFLPRSLRLAPK